MLDPRHPTAILRAAWLRVRLDVIRAAAAEAIAELEALDRSIADAPDPADVRSEASKAALLACCDELREEGGLPARPSQPAALSQGDSAWSRTYTSELARFRTLAGASLGRLLAAD
jgi:hypothetical protein